jgi:hypothetical protein
MTKREIMSGVESVKSRLVGNNTVEYWRENNERVIRLHNTDIITFKPNGDVVLDSGGWKTITTKARMNNFDLHVRVYQDKSIWYVHQGSWNDPESTVPFYDGMVLPKGNLPKLTKRMIQAQRATERLKNRINKFVKQIDKLDEMPAPASGDCLFCSMFERSDQGKMFSGSGGRIRNPGYRTKNATHLQSHITVKENYLHGSLIWNAHMWTGGSAFLWQMHKERWDKWAKDDTKRMLRRYLKAQLGVA